LPFPAPRKDVGKYADWRTLDAAVAPFVRDEIRRSWAVASHVLSGKSIVKLSLHTGDLATACDRWSEVHARVEALIRDATTLAKRDEEAKRKLEKVRTLTSKEKTTIAGQARYDVLASQSTRGRNADRRCSALRRSVMIESDCWAK